MHCGEAVRGKEADNGGEGEEGVLGVREAVGKVGDFRMVRHEAC